MLNLDKSIMNLMNLINKNRKWKNIKNKYGFMQAMLAQVIICKLNLRI